MWRYLPTLDKRNHFAIFVTIFLRNELHYGGFLEVPQEGRLGQGKTKRKQNYIFTIEEEAEGKGEEEEEEAHHWIFTFNAKKAQCLLFVHPSIVATDL